MRINRCTARTGRFPTRALAASRPWTNHEIAENKVVLHAHIPCIFITSFISVRQTFIVIFQINRILRNKRKSSVYDGHGRAICMAREMSRRANQKMEELQGQRRSAKSTRDEGQTILPRLHVRQYKHQTLFKSLFNRLYTALVCSPILESKAVEVWNVE